MRHLNLLTLIVFITLFSCNKEEPQELGCPESIDYGLIALSEDALSSIPNFYQSEENLVFKNLEGEEIIFYPQFDSIRLGYFPKSTNILCNEQPDALLEYEVEKLEISYQSTNNYVLYISIEPKPIINREIPASPLSFFYTLELRMFHITNADIGFDEICFMKFSISYAAANTTNISDTNIDYEYIEQLELLGKSYRGVYLSNCENIPLAYHKQSGLISFTDTEGVEWIFDRVEGYNEQIAPDIVLPDTTGQPLMLSELEGELILIDFWASWCIPCRIETEETLKPLYDEYNEKGLEILSISIDTERQEWIEAIEEDEMNWYHASDLQGYTSPIFTLYQIYAIPTIYVLDKDRNILSRELRGELLAQFVREYLD